MCMMKQNSEKESCEVAKSLADLRAHVDAGDKRLTALESTVSEMRKESQSGFAQLSVSVNALGHDFGERMNLIEKKVVDEKQEWGKSFRKWLDWIVKLLILGCGAAMGMTAWKMIFGN